MPSDETISQGSESPEPVDNKPDIVESNILEIPEDFIAKLYEAARSQGYPVDESTSLTIREGFNEILFSGHSGGQDIARNSVNERQLALLQKAVGEPDGLKGSIRIYVGNEKIFHNKNGEVITDSLNLVAKFQVIEHEQQPEQQLSDQPSATEQNESKNIGEQRSKEQSQPGTQRNLESEIDALQSQVENLQKQIDVLTAALQSKPSLAVASEKLGSWLNGVRSEVKTTGEQVQDQLSVTLEEHKVTLKSRIREFVSGTQQQVSRSVQFAQERVSDVIYSARDTVQNKISEAALGAVSAATARVATAIGEKLPDGRVVIDSEKRGKVLEIQDGKMSLKDRPQVDPQAIWDKYSQGFSSDRPIQRTVAAIQQALRDGNTRATVRAMLTADPHIQEIGKNQGPQKANEQIIKLTRSAVDKLKVAKVDPQPSQRREINVSHHV